MYKSEVHQRSLLTVLGPAQEQPIKKLKTIVNAKDESDEDDEFKDAYSDEEEIKEEIKKSQETSPVVPVETP